jgi:hypothetical protein
VNKDLGKAIEESGKPQLNEGYSKFVPKFTEIYKKELTEIILKNINDDKSGKTAEVLSDFVDGPRHYKRNAIKKIYSIVEQREVEKLVKNDYEPELKKETEVTQEKIQEIK